MNTNSMRKRLGGKQNSQSTSFADEEEKSSRVEKFFDVRATCTRSNLTSRRELPMVMLAQHFSSELAAR
jgi:hypothetical protein